MIIEYDTEDRCIRVDDVAVSHADAEKLMAEHETAPASPVPGSVRPMLPLAIRPAPTKQGMWNCSPFPPSFL